MTLNGRMMKKYGYDRVIKSPLFCMSTDHLESFYPQKFPLLYSLYQIKTTITSP